MIRTQQELDACLDRLHRVQVRISPDGPLPQNQLAYEPIVSLIQNGFSFTTRQLLHAIGCKTAALPVSANDECFKSAWLYTNILDIEGPYLSFRGTYGSDLQIARSQEIGIGMMCLIAEKCLGIPWDQLGPLPGQGKRFDYRGVSNQWECIFESKGTSHRENQSSQIKNGLEKKDAHHMRGEHFDIELIISFYIGHNGNEPRVLLADPDKSSFKELYNRGDDRYFRLKHYCRVLQYVGLPKSAYYLNRYAMDYLYKRRSIYKTIIAEKEERGYLKSININGDEFLGQWFRSWLPKNSTRYKRLYNREKSFFVASEGKQREVFQGMRRDVYDAGLRSEPFLYPLMMKKNDIERYHSFDGMGVSIFTDGTIMIFKQREFRGQLP